jgi:phospholipase C
MHDLWRRCSALVASTALANMVLSPLAMAQSVTLQPYPTADVVAAGINSPGQDPVLSKLQIAQLLQKKIKYVFVIFNENHSFDNEYGTLPGVNGLYADASGNARSAANTPGFNQTYTDLISGATVTVQPFLIGPAQNASSVDSVDHSHTGLAKKIHVVNGAAQMDQFALDEYSRFATAGGAANNAKGTQFARLVMSHIDCNTIPFFWQWATRFTVFDNIFATEDTPSSPNAIAMIAGQSGETQWVKHPNTGAINASLGTTGPTVTNGALTNTLIGPPVWGDAQPFYGSPLDPTTTNRVTTCVYDGCSTTNPTNIAAPATYATLPLTFMGNQITSTLAGNRNPSVDLADIQNDMPYIQKLNYTPVNWRWYQDGYGLESTDSNGVASNTAYVSHHNGAQYFGYIANTPSVAANMKSETQFFTDIASSALPNGGVFYIRGGYKNQMGLLPPVTNPNMPAAEVTAMQAAKSGDDDHPSYTDRMISEAMAARVINAVAGNPTLWSQSAIIITYDESDGFYDHVPPRILSYGPDGLPLARGVRIPLILISPYARAAAVSHAEGDHNAVIQTINTIFGLPALASLPDEAAALAAGNSSTFNQFGPAGFQQQYLGPRDLNSPTTDSLLSGFDPKRLLGLSAPLPASLAMIPTNVVSSLPHYNGNGCSAIGVTPMDARLGVVNTVPAGFNPLPSTYSAAN